MKADASKYIWIGSQRYELKGGREDEEKVRELLREIEKEEKERRKKQEEKRIKNIEKFIIEQTKKDPVLKQKLDLFFETRSHSLYNELYKEYPEIMDTIYPEIKNKRKEIEKEKIRREKEKEEEWVDGEENTRKKNTNRSKKYIGKIMSRRTKRRRKNKKSLKH